MKTWLAAAGIALAFSSLALAAPVKVIVAVDGYHNCEPRSPTHYAWDGKDNGGFSQLGELIKGIGASLTTVRRTITGEELARINVLIIVDPDNVGESSPNQPNLIGSSEIDALVEWVNAGGVLILMGNDKGNCQLKELSELGGKFGIKFNEDTAGTGGQPSFAARSDSPLFKDVRELHIVQMCSLTVQSPAQPVLKYDGIALMATARAGKGVVFAVGDPWFYNEYIDRKDNRQAAANLFTWAIGQATAAK